MQTYIFTERLSDLSEGALRTLLGSRGLTTVTADDMSIDDVIRQVNHVNGGEVVITTTNTPYELAKQRYHAACREFSAAALDEIRRHAVKHFPTATSIVLEGEYGDDGEFKIHLHAVNLSDGTTSYEEADDFPELEEAIDEHLLYLAGTTGEDYLGRETFVLPSP